MNNEKLKMKNEKSSAESGVCSVELKMKNLGFFSASSVDSARDEKKDLVNID